MKTSIKKITALFLIALTLCLGACSDDTASPAGIVEVPVDKFTAEFVFGENGLIEKEKKYYDNLEKQYEYYECYEYNENNQITKRYATDLEGNVLENHDLFEMTYDENGKLQKITENNFSYIYQYYENGELKGVTKHEGEPPAVVNVKYFEYDENGNLTKEIFETADKKTSDTTIYTYNENGLLVSASTTNSAGNSVIKSSYEYNSDGLISKLTKEKNRETRTTVYEYKNGVLVEEKMTVTPSSETADREAREYITAYEYLGDGKVVKFTRERDGEVYITDTYSADEAKGNFADFENIITL